MAIRPLLLLFALLSAVPAVAQFPDGYTDELFLQGLQGPVGLVFDEAGGLYAWERGGRVYQVQDGALVQPPLVDISDEVGNWRDFGMLGFALDPSFLQNGRLYLYYVVDRHHLLYAGTPDYDPNANEYFDATIGRITRYSADAATGFSTLIPGSRQVLLGATPDDGVPILFESHGTGSLCFGSDGTLLASSGDGAHYGVVDAGSVNGTYWSRALADGILRPEENVGAFRSQLLESLSGKILRIDPETGDGVPSNPFFEPDAPHSRRSRVWALGLRNPFRFRLRPGSGSTDPLVGDPGAIYLADVGWSRLEDLHVIDEAGANLGWPLFEGLTPQPDYKNAPAFNLDAPNPLFGVGECDQPYFSFKSLIRQERADHSATFPNPCDESVSIPLEIPTFLHRRPAIDWKHLANIARVPTYESDGSASFKRLGDADCPVTGDPFSGICAVAGCWLDPFGFGPYSGSFVAMDFSGWMRMLRFDGEDRLQAVETFGGPTSPVYAIQDPGDGSLLYIELNFGHVRRLTYTGGSNAAPEPLLDAPPGPFTSRSFVRFDASSSVDPEGAPLIFHWDFGDGNTSSEPSPIHRFTSSYNQPAVARVTLTTTDPQLAEASTAQLVHFNNTAPQVAITSFSDGATYSTSEPTVLSLEADVFDAEHGPEELSYTWQVFLRHDTHEHPEAPIHEVAPTVTLTPTSCNGPFYAYRIELTVRDAQGLTTQVRHWLFPDCEASSTPILTGPSVGDVLLPGQATTLTAEVAGPVQSLAFQVDGEPLATLLTPPFEVSWTPERSGRHTISALATLAGSGTATSTGLAIDVAVPRRIEVELRDPRGDAFEAPDGSLDLLSGQLLLGGGLSGLRFPLAVPQGATIVSATLELTSAGSSASPTSVVLRGEASDDAAPVSNTPFDLSSRPTTLAAVDWSIEPWIYANASGVRQRSPDLRAIVQEVVDRPGWAEGQALLFLADGSGERRALSFEKLGSRSARLVVEFD